jgi:hypothetical protein
MANGARKTFGDGIQRRGGVVFPSYSAYRSTCPCSVADVVAATGRGHFKLSSLDNTSFGTTNFDILLASLPSLQL